jgi:hypothetical protein
VKALIKLLSGQILCVQHDLKRVNSRARSFKILCVSACVSPSRNAKEQQGGDSNGGPKSGLTDDRSLSTGNGVTGYAYGRLSDVLRGIG